MDGDRSEDPRAAAPDAIVAIGRTLREAGHRALWVGGGVRDLHLGRALRDFDLASDAAPEAVLALFPRAVPIGLRHGTVMIPTPAGPVDVTRFRGDGTLESDLAHRDFTLNAMAVDLESGAWLDPHGGREDLARGVLRAVGSAEERLREDPLRGLRALRFVAELGLAIDPPLLESVRHHAGDLAGVAGERIRRELERLLLGASVEAGLGALRETGIEARLAPGVGDDAARVVAATPAEPLARLTAWLRGTDAGGILGRLRFPRRVASQVQARVAAHPLEAGGLGLAALRRRHRRLGDQGIDALLALRRTELAVGSVADEERSQVEARVEKLAAAITELRARGALDLERVDLAASGADVMRWLGCGPGPRVGAALRWLTERVAEDPSHNAPERLRALLDRWPGDDEPGATS